MTPALEVAGSSDADVIEAVARRLNATGRRMSSPALAARKIAGCRKKAREIVPAILDYVRTKTDPEAFSAGGAGQDVYKGAEQAASIALLLIYPLVTEAMRLVIQVVATWVLDWLVNRSASAGWWERSGRVAA